MTSQNLAGVFLAGAGLGAAGKKDYGLAQSLLNQSAMTIGANQSSNQSANAGLLGNRPNNGKDIIGYVTLTSTEMSVYTDGYAYDVLTLMPTTDGKSGGDWVYQYGIPVGNARSLLATGYALAGKVSAYGSGNPSQSISWQRKSVRVGSTIKMGIEWKRNQAAPKAFSNRYANKRI